MNPNRSDLGKLFIPVIVLCYSRWESGIPGSLHRAAVTFIWRSANRATSLSLSLSLYLFISLCFLSLLCVSLFPACFRPISHSLFAISLSCSLPHFYSNNPLLFLVFPSPPAPLSCPVSIVSVHCWIKRQFWRCCFCFRVCLSFLPNTPPSSSCCPLSYSQDLKVTSPSDSMSLFILENTPLHCFLSLFHHLSQRQPQVSSPFARLSWLLSFNVIYPFLFSVWVFSCFLGMFTFFYIPVLYLSWFFLNL